MTILKINYKKKLGKNKIGHIITRYKQIGTKSLYIPIDLNYFNYIDSYDSCIKLLSIKHNYMYRNTKLMLSLCIDGKSKGEFRYILKPSKRIYGDTIKFSEQSNKKFGDMNYLCNFDINDKLYNIEFKPKIHSKICVSACSYSILLNKKITYVIIKLPSNEKKILVNKCYVNYGFSEKIDNYFKNKAGTSRLLGYRPKVRGSAMNACDHPHGGGEGKSPIGKKYKCSFKGKRAKGVKTVSLKK